MREIDEALSGAAVRAFQLVEGAIAGSVLMYAAVVGFLLATGRQQSPDPESEEMLKVLSLVHAATFLGLGGLSVVLSRPRGAGKESASQAVAGLRTSRILRLAALEMGGMFGLTVCLMAALSGWLQQQPLYALNALSALFVVAFALVTFPTRQRLLGALARRMEEG